MPQRKRTELIRLAAARHYAGASFRVIGDELGLSAATIHRWSTKEKTWGDEWQRLESEARAQRKRVFLSQSELVETTGKRLGEFCLSSLESALQSQQAIAESLKDIQLPGTINSLEELSVAIRCMKDLASLVNTTWENFQVATDLEEFFEHNQSPPEIEFSEYSPEEILEIQEQN